MIDFFMIGRCWAMLYRTQFFLGTTELSPEDFFHERLASVHPSYVRSRDEVCVRRYNDAADGFAADMDRVATY